ncbi:phage tail protein [Pseudomonas alliivorans]|uniref:phage tail protein n=1 Tax=Pseudomonas alliivorans TaxID=2810613 RepID=UPI001AE6932E|nr:phage tail protein [Pseudomonas alliivorans]MBP0948961.1 phage tail protein [Pseudomonas alliivorans]MEE4683657.1 phage tail protein [Pseudomonas alliivorans]MEE5060555.1 phage tail protein [Pseudomonas alliivorans]MEE5086161.1 phage tail protein [Pseudomonas alliivorans]MEE5088003.1 phage tail protein [Pseudomonas alliivorans]
MSNIDWSQLITKDMKASAAAAEALSAAKQELVRRNSLAMAQIARIQDRIETLGYGIDIGEATQDEIAEQADLTVNLNAWKAYKYALGKVTALPGWFKIPAWPTAPATPEIAASPMQIVNNEV